MVAEAIGQVGPESIATDLASRLFAAAARNPVRRSAAKVVVALAGVAAELSDLLALGPLAGNPGASTGAVNADGDSQKALDVIANSKIFEALKRTPTAYLASEEEEAIVTLSRHGLVAVAVDPLDGSSNIDANVSIGTIFSIFPAADEGATASFFRSGDQQIAAGYFIYGPYTSLVFSTGAGVDVYVLDRASRTFKLAIAGATIAPDSREFAINASNYRHWLEPVRNFIDDCFAGAEGPRAKDFNMRWIASLVAETHRIFTRGGLFLYPADNRKGYEKGRLRLIYEAAPIAYLVEQAGGGATDGARRILELEPSALHQRTPLIFGSANKVKRLQSYHNDPAYQRDSSPLFRSRGLFSS